MANSTNFCPDFVAKGLLNGGEVKCGKFRAGLSKIGGFGSLLVAFMVMNEEVEDVEEGERWLGDGGRDSERIPGPGEFIKMPFPSYFVPSRLVFGTTSLIRIRNAKPNC